MRRNWVGFLGCLVQGHDDRLARAPGRLFLRCEGCGLETPGWVIGGGPATPGGDDRASRVSAAGPAAAPPASDVAMPRRRAA